MVIGKLEMLEDISEEDLARISIWSDYFDLEKLKLKLSTLQKQRVGKTL
jgi:hypothetical protein